jgi:hypothetical protein
LLEPSAFFEIPFDPDRAGSRLYAPKHANGLTEFLALATNGASFTSLVLFSNSGFSQIKQFEISGLTALTAVPLPWGASCCSVPALVGLGVIGRRRKKGLAA